MSFYCEIEVVKTFHQVFGQRIDQTLSFGSHQIHVSGYVRETADGGREGREDASTPGDRRQRKRRLAKRPPFRRSHVMHATAIAAAIVE